MQHADHFTRILNEQETFRKAKYAENKADNDKTTQEKTIKIDEVSNDKVKDETQEKKITKMQSDIN